MDIKFSDKLSKLPPYLFVELDRAKQEAIKKGRDVIDLGIGDPDLPTPKPIIEKLYKAALDSKNHRYPTNRGLLEFRQSVQRWYKRRFNVSLDVETEILPLIGSKEGIANIPTAFLNQGDEVLVPDPGYPVYKSAVIFAGGIIHIMPLLESNGFLPDLDAIDVQVARRAKLMYLNYPNNPTSAVASVDYLEKVVEFAKSNNIIVVYDAAYSENYYEGCKPIAFLEIDGAKEVGIEMHSLSKTYNMTGWRIGFALGNKDIIAGLAKVKSNIDSGVFQAVQEAAITALDTMENETEKMRQIYQARRDVIVNGFKKLGWDVEKPMATFYVWIKVPSGYTSSEISKLFLDKADIIVTPGIGFGINGEGYIRIALTVDKDRLQEAVNRIERLKF